MVGQYSLIFFYPPWYMHVHPKVAEKSNVSIDIQNHGLVLCLFVKLLNSIRELGLIQFIKRVQLATKDLFFMQLIFCT